MCNPVALGWAAVALTAAGGYVDYQNTKNAAKVNARIAENNAVLAEQGAKDEAILSSREQQEAAWRTRAVVGSQKAALAANMIDSGEGTGFDLLGETALFGGAEQSAIAQDAARKAWGLQSQALNFRNEADLSRWQGKAQGNATILKTLGSMADGVSSMYSGGAAASSGSRSFTASSGMSYRVPTTRSGAGWHNAYGARR